MSQVSSGWLAVDETWTRASNTTFTTAGDKTDKYQKGDKIKLTQSGNVKYFYIIGIVYSSPNTTITVTGGSDYSLVSATITEPYFSKVENPQGFPQWFNWTPTYGGKELTYTSVTGITKFSIQGGKVLLFINVTGTVGGTARAFIGITPPFTMASETYGAYIFTEGSNKIGYYGGSTTQIWFYKYDTAFSGSIHLIATLVYLY